MHVAIIMDGNGRWARSRNLRREAGHRAGARAVDAVIRAAARHGVTHADAVRLLQSTTGSGRAPRSRRCSACCVVTS